MEKETQNSENLEIPSRWRRFFTYFLDLIINFAVIWLIISINIWIMIVIIIANLAFIIYYKTTIWNKIMWIVALNNKNSSINWWQSALRYFVFYPPFLQLILSIVCYLFLAILNIVLINYKLHVYDIDIHPIKMWMIWFIIFGLIFLLINVIELFFKCPTFIDKLLWIKRLYKKS